MAALGNSSGESGHHLPGPQVHGKSRSPYHGKVFIMFCIDEQLKVMQLGMLPGCVKIMIAMYILKANTFSISSVSDLRNIRGYTVVSAVHCRYSDHFEGISVSTTRDDGTEQSHRGGARRQVV
jgi:hypothetical protein